MTYLLARLVEPLLRFFLPARGRRRHTYPYSCPYVGRPYLDHVETYA